MLDPSVVRRAVRRAPGARFRVAMPLSRRCMTWRPGARLTWSDVQAIRRWAGGEGWGLTRSAQAELLAARYSTVTSVTLYQVLSGSSWPDPSYVPDALDLSYWRSAGPTAILLRALMPFAPLRPCSTPGCQELTQNGPCPTHARQREQRRGTAHARGYTYRDWQPFRKRFLAALVDAGITPCCGAALPTGPSPDASECRARGLFTFSSGGGKSLHFDHEPALQDHERRDVTKVCDLNRIVLLCASCHSAKTARDMRGGL